MYHIYIHIYIYVYIHTCIYTHAHIHIYHLCLQGFNAENLVNKTHTHTHIFIYLNAHIQTYESWTIKKSAEELMFWNCVLEKTLESPLDSKKSNQSILKEINPEYSLEGLILKLKLQYFGQLMLRAESLEKTLMLGKIEGKRRVWQRGDLYCEELFSPPLGGESWAIKKAEC